MQRISLSSANLDDDLDLVEATNDLLQDIKFDGPVKLMIQLANR